MEYLREGDIIIMSTALMELIGEADDSTSLKVMLYRLVNSIVLVTIVVFICANFWYAEQSALIATMEDMCSVLHTLFKYLLIIYYKSDIRGILDARIKKFWMYRHYVDDIVAAKIENSYKITKMILITMFYVMIFIELLFLLKPAFSSTNVFLFKSKMLVDSIVAEALLLALHYYFFLLITQIVLGYDSIYLSLCIDLTMQLKVLKYRLKIILSEPTECVKEEIIKCIEYHLLLLRIYQRMQGIYSMTFFFHYFTSLLTACCDMYQFLVGGTQLSNSILKIVSLGAIVSQFAFYAIPAEIVSSEFSSISQAVYMSKWYENDVTIQKLMLPMIIRAQNSKYFSGAGFIDMNVGAFASLVNRAFSFYTVAKNLLDT